MTRILHCLTFIFGVLLLSCPASAQPAAGGKVVFEVTDSLHTPLAYATIALKAHADGYVGMAANMIGVNKAIIVFDNEGTPCEMFNPVILYHKGLYLAEEGCLSLQGQPAFCRYH
mgnify:CR=1 FL=1